MNNMSGHHFYMTYSVTIASDGGIHVQAGDTISAYCAAMYKLPVGQTQAHWGEFGRKPRENTDPLPLIDPNKIEADETLFHLGTYQSSKRKKPTVRQRLLKIIPLLTSAEATCMVRQACFLLRHAEDPLLDDWHNVNAAMRYARYGGSTQNFDYQLAREALDLGANHVLPALRKHATEFDDDNQLAKIISRLSKRIVENLQQIRARTRSTGPLNKPWLSVIDEWQQQRLRNPQHLLYCYRHVYGIK